MQELGQLLKEERLRQGISLEELSSLTCVSIDMLQALEDGRYRSIGIPLLIRSFIRAYCSVLGIDAESILEQYGTRILDYDIQSESLKQYKRWMYSSRQRNSACFCFLMISGLALVVGAVAGLWFLPRANVPSTQTPEKAFMYSQEPVPGRLSESSVSSLNVSSRSLGVPVETAKSIERLPADNSGVQKAGLKEENEGSSEIFGCKHPENSGSTEKVSPGRHVLVLVAKEKTWLEVRTADGKYRCLLMPGDRRQWEVTGKVRLWLGNAGGVEGTWDGRPLKTFGRSGEVVRIYLPNPDYFAPQVSADVHLGCESE